MIASVLLLAAHVWRSGFSSNVRLEPPLAEVLIVGGGPDKAHNQVAIESNVRYVDRLLPKRDPRRILFADGDLTKEDVQYQEVGREIRYRASQIGHVDGGSSLSNVRDEIARMVARSAAHPKDPVLLYFTGHGSPNSRSQYENNFYDLWGSQSLDVKTLATAVDAFPDATPITLVMVECFSGAFANLLFDGGDPGNQLSRHHLCGFFASVPQREAAGCTPEVNEANYRDFTSFFFAALTGIDRLGNHVSGADYNRDGRVGMDEAFAYSLIHDDSIDTPVCTSDLFLRHFVTTPNDQVFGAKFSDVQNWATPAQRAALTELSSDLALSGEYRLATAYDAFKKMDPSSEELHDVHLLRFVRVANSVVRAHTLLSEGSPTLKARYQELVREESGNLLR